MRIKSICVKDTLPIRHFEVSDLTNIVFVAGPNGIGKSRLIEAFLKYLQHPMVSPNIRMKIEATSESETAAWGKKLLDTGVKGDCIKLQQSLQKNQSRRNFRSSILYFESNRHIQPLGPLLYDNKWEQEDPYKEEVNYRYTSQPLKNRVRDTIHCIFKKIQSQKTSIANQAIQLQKEGKDSMNLTFSDPLDPYREAFEQLLSPKTLIGISGEGKSIRIADGSIEMTEEDLSSGEREVLNIVFDFVLRQPSGCVVFFDEPELHLHPELANKLIATLKTVGEGNQFIFCTHSAELLSGSLDNTVIFIQPQNSEETNQAVHVSMENETFDALQAIGQSMGVVSLGKRIVLIEGTDSSLDKKTYLQIIKGRFPNLVLVPCEGKHTIQSFGHVADSVLSRTIWGVDFFLLADRDAFPEELAPKIEERGLTNKVRSLNRYHLENYFLDEHILSQIFSEMEDEDSWLCDPEKILEKLKSIAESRISYTVALTVSKYLRDTVGNVDLMVKGCQDMSKDELSVATADKAKNELARVQSGLDADAVSAKTAECYERFTQSITDGTWKENIPGKQIFKAFASKANMDPDRLKTLYIKKAMAIEGDQNPFADIFLILDKFSST